MLAEATVKTINKPTLLVHKVVTRNKAEPLFSASEAERRKYMCDGQAWVPELLHVR